ncbi:MAG: phytoene desaturase family protein [Solirubrobacteraceae bacterium]
MRDGYDAIIIGSGHNGLVAAAYLARAGWRVAVLERNAVAGGCIATEELTVPGYRHDTMSSWHPLFHLSAAWAELGTELGAHGLRYANSEETVAASAMGDGRVLLVDRDPAHTVEQFTGADQRAYLAAYESFGAHAEAVGALMGAELHSLHGVRLAAALTRRLRRRGSLAFGAQMLWSARSWLATDFEGREAADLLAPWVLHTGLSPDAAGGGFQALAIAATLHQVGLPVVRGGADGFVHAFTRLIESHGGEVICNSEVERIVVRGGRAAGVIAGGSELTARRSVIANVTPPQLYGRLLLAGDAPPAAREQAARYRFNPRAGMQIHLALSQPPRWRDERLAAAPIVHLTDGLDGVSLACAQATCGLLPARPTIVCGQQTVLDPERAPDGGAIIWIQLQEVPFRPRGDAAGEIDVGDGEWTQALTDAYTQRILARLAEWIENLDEVVVGRAVLPPPELERRNCNLVGGDIYAGDAELDQSYLWRPLPGYGSHATPVADLYQCGASTFPGPGLNASSGRTAAGLALAAHGDELGARLARTARRAVAIVR